MFPEPTLPWSLRSGSRHLRFFYLHLPRQPPTDHGYRFPPETISHGVWLYHRLCLSYRDGEDLPISASSEAVILPTICRSLLGLGSSEDIVEIP